MSQPATHHTHTLSSESFIPDESNHRLLRNALGCFGTGVTIVTAATIDGPAAITANSFSSVSLTPPLVLWSLDKNSSRFNTFSNAENYSIHVLNTQQEDLCMDVARNPALLSAQNLHTNDFGVPVLDDCMVRFDCSLETTYEAGDHVIILGRVQLATQHNSCDPLMFYRGDIRNLASQNSTAA